MLIRGNSCLNKEYCNESIEDVYEELFVDALKRYNYKQTKNDRKIEIYDKALENITEIESSLKGNVKYKLPEPQGLLQSGHKVKIAEPVIKELTLQ